MFLLGITGGGGGGRGSSMALRGNGPFFLLADFILLQLKLL